MTFRLAILPLAAVLLFLSHGRSADSRYHYIDALCTRDAPQSTPFDDLDPVKAEEYRRVFRLGYFSSWNRHLRCPPKYGPLDSTWVSRALQAGFLAGKAARPDASKP